MTQGLYNVAEVAAMIEKGDTLLLAGDAALLSQLPKGKWIAGATSRFVEKGGALVTTREKIFVHNVTDVAANVKLKTYDAATLPNIFDDAFDNGFSVLIVPVFSDVWKEYGANCSNYSNFAYRAVCGWVAVAPIYSEYEQNDASLVFSGETGMSYLNEGVVMHIAVPEGKYAEVHVISPFKPDDNDVIIFEENTQHIEYALINGVRQNFRQYLIDRRIGRSQESGVSSRKCLAGDFAGFIMNVSIAPETEIDAEKYVTLGTPVYKGITYRLANRDNMSYENEAMYTDNKIVCSFACITNFSYPEVFQKYLTQMNGPFTYGEIAYFLLNYATAYVTVGDKTN